MTDKKGPLALIILDGFGHSDEREGNAVALASMPFYDELRERYPHTLIEASGECVGLPAGVMGNSNVGHLCMGAGRIVRTDIERINHEIRTRQLEQNLVLEAAIESALKNERALHLMGLTSDGLVHSSQEHAFALL
ncbi:MAG TPA: 2,3-bisphosphoglycerate-independent phosphoglycerate mutase, partial [Pyrinomonadaceae bacterium]|nr:2,3-bisphosphoglycerate-independent phosphoglycerate mutase [Pyrinomonadaceae bacterium]